MTKIAQPFFRFFCFIVAAMLAFPFIPLKQSAVAFDGEILRFHVIANSDSPEDQALKLKVRDRVLEVWKKISAEADSATEAQSLALSELSLLREVALDVMDAEGYDYNVSVSCGVYPFPVKSYGNVTLPAGDYNAVRIVIGEGGGKNWWCVMYPPLCFVDETVKFDDDALSGLSESTKKQILTKPGIKIKFKINELFR